MRERVMSDADTAEDARLAARRTMNLDRMRQVVLLCTRPGCVGEARHLWCGRWEWVCDMCDARWHIESVPEPDDDLNFVRDSYGYGWVLDVSRTADAILGSRWLAARDAKVRAETARGIAEAIRASSKAYRVRQNTNYGYHERPSIDVHDAARIAEEWAEEDRR